MADSEDNQLCGNINVLIDRVNSLELDNHFLNARLEQLEKQLSASRQERGVKSKTKPKVPPKPIHFVSNAHNLKDSVQTLTDKVKSSEDSNSNLRFKIEEVEGKIKLKKTPPPVPQKPPKKLMDNLKSDIPFKKELEAKNPPVMKYLHISEEANKSYTSPVINPVTNTKLPYTLFPVNSRPQSASFGSIEKEKPVCTLKRSSSNVSSKNSYFKAEDEYNSLGRKKTSSQTSLQDIEYSPLVSNIIKTAKVKENVEEPPQPDVYDMPMFRAFRENFVNMIVVNKREMHLDGPDEQVIRKTPSLSSFSSFSSDTSHSSPKVITLGDNPEPVRHCFPELDGLLQRIAEIESCIDLEEQHEREESLENNVFNAKNRLAAMVPSTLAAIMISADDQEAIKTSTSGENKQCEIKNSTLEKEQEVQRGHILTELLKTERVYVNELGSIIQGYKVPLLSEEAKEIAPDLYGKVDVMFGNFDEIYQFHNDVFLQDLENCIGLTDELVALCFTHRRDTLHKLYSTYCQNIARSERFRQSIGDHAFLKACQNKLGHKLPLAAYLLKPVQRITKYQLLLKELLSCSEGKKWCGDLQEALECMLVVLKCVNDSMHQLAVTDFWGDLGDLGDLLMQGSFSVSSENKKERWQELRLKPMQRHLFLYQKALMFCKKADAHNKETYHFKKLIMMSDVGLTETVRGDGRTFEIWLTGRSEVHRIQATDSAQKGLWVDQIKTLLLEQLTQLKLKQYTSKSSRSMSLDHSRVRGGSVRGLSCDEGKPKAAPSDDDIASSSDCSNSDDEETFSNQVSHDQTIIIPYSQGSRYKVLADYIAVGHSEISMKEGDLVTLLKVGWAGWWYVRLYGVSEGTRKEGWVPAAYLEHCGRKSSRSCQSVTSDNSSH